MLLKRVTAIVIMSVAVSAIADTGHHPEEAKSGTATQMPKATGQMPMTGNQSGSMPMMQGQRMPMMSGHPGGLPMAQGQGMPMMQMMQERHAMMQSHMLKMESHMANIEALLEQLVELQSKQ